ncbi:MAG: ubiquinol-cytochrome c reductase iron-sulfur subunit [Bryobacterales bacterium]|nr:ubiquinol-cytochrome c reductase iron-sulfur subunit [Bryobacterales bacterium]
MSEEQAGGASGTSLLGRIKASIQAEGKDEEAKIRSRRRLIGLLTGGFLTTNFLMFLRFFFPRTIFEPRTQFRIGLPTDYGIGVDTRFQKSNRIWVVRTTDRLFVIYASCTHLGCTPDWKLSEAKFKCPCHGSGYDPEGRNYEGPAPRPMDRAYVELDPQGRIVVDTSVLYREEKGQDTQFDAQGSYIQV